MSDIGVAPLALLADLPPVAPSTTIQSAAQNALIDRVNALSKLGVRAYATTNAQTGGIAAATLDVAGLSVTWSAEPGRLYRVRAVLEVGSTVAGDIPVITIANGSNVEQTRATGRLSGTASETMIVEHLMTVAAASTETRKVRCVRAIGTGTLSAGGGSQWQASIIVEDIGPTP